MTANIANIANTAAGITDTKLTDLKLTANIANKHFGFGSRGRGRAERKGPKFRHGLQEIF